MLNDKVGIASIRITLKAYWKGTDKLAAVIKAHNLLVNEGLDLIGDLLVDIQSAGLSYCEIGTDNTAPALPDTTLTAFHKRKAITSKWRTAQAVYTSTFFLASEATAVIEEIGIWGGDLAAAGEATGELFNHALVSYDNSAGSFDIVIETTHNIVSA